MYLIQGCLYIIFCYFSIVAFQVGHILECCGRIDLNDIAVNGCKKMTTIGKSTLYFRKVRLEKKNHNIIQNSWIKLGLLLCIHEWWTLWIVWCHRWECSWDEVCPRSRPECTSRTDARQCCRLPQKTLDKFQELY